jgi:hypothetical protein
VQAIGGVNEKIEGFFDLCKARGLTGDQGVLIPESNVKHLMLRQDVVETVQAGQFHVYPVTHIDQGIEVLDGNAGGRARQARQVSEGHGQPRRCDATGADGQEAAGARSQRPGTEDAGIRRQAGRTQSWNRSA